MTECWEISDDGFLCTREDGHGGVFHVAALGCGESIRWPIKEARHVVS